MSKKKSAKRSSKPAGVRRSASPVPGPRTPHPVFDWRTTVQAYWQNVPDLHQSGRLVRKLQRIAGTLDAEAKLADLVEVMRSLTMPPGVILSTMLDAGLTREGHEIDRVAAEILAVL